MITQDRTATTSRVTHTQFIHSLKLLTLLIMENMQYSNGLLSIFSHGYRQHKAIFWPFDLSNLGGHGPFREANYRLDPQAIRTISSLRLSQFQLTDQLLSVHRWSPVTGFQSPWMPPC
jgi:hypothetical protein